MQLIDRARELMADLRFVFLPETLENRIEHYAKKRRIQVSVREVGEEGGNKED